MFGVLPGRGSLLTVIPHAGARSAAWMRHEARRHGTDESSFVIDVRPHEYVVRVFNPWRESPYGGHSAAGTAALLVARGQLDPGRQQQRLPSGSATTVWTDGQDVAIDFRVTTRARDVDRRQLAAVLPHGHPYRSAQAIHGGPGAGFSLLDVSAPPLEVDAPDLAAMRAHELDDLTLFHWDAQRRTATARVFAPGYAIDVDAACAPVAAAIGEHLARTHPDVVDTEICVRQVADAGQDACFVVTTTANDQGMTTTVKGRVWIMDEQASESQSR
ncbi:PhzF family phenazine biosynthesis protein [Streptomyces sp. 7N604]|uniref:PhzF family phenazine biosynthesis protein n=1 Tax=Streptomyces sp. 7N604 TaxID=3457415 RepID=UPI003FD0B928